MPYSKREIIGIILWWAEGTKSRRDIRWKNAVSYPVEITNTNPAIIKLFVDFLRKDVGIPKQRFRLQIQIHEGDDKLGLEKYWQHVTGIPRHQFNKTIVRPVGKKVGKSNGTCKVRFADKSTYKKLELKLIEVLDGVYNAPEPVLRVYDASKREGNLLE
ncbi:hypothetical protein KC950_01905 [Candidatus Saccharibacteria bacterium]|nr:hypothetical protein [Candidatus Saccharibacteria bacterium]MCA9342750.1 hypothetical protein [Candidatus Saccharibacteria bacterium]